MIKIAAILAFSLSLAFGDELPNDVKRLLTQKDQAVKKVDAKFVSQLEQLKKRYMKRGDLNAAITIQDLIAGIAHPQEKIAVKVTEFSNSLVGQKWTWGSNQEVSMSFISEREIRDYAGNIWTYTRTGERTIEYKTGSGYHGTIEFNKNYTKFEAHETAPNGNRYNMPQKRL